MQLLMSRSPAELDKNPPSSESPVYSKAVILGYSWSRLHNLSIHSRGLTFQPRSSSDSVVDVLCSTSSGALPKLSKPPTPLESFFITNCRSSVFPYPPTYYKPPLLSLNFASVNASALGFSSAASRSPSIHPHAQASFIFDMRRSPRDH